MGAGKGRQFKRGEGKGEIIAAPQAAALACLGPGELAAKAVMCAHLILGAIRAK